MQKIVGKVQVKPLKGVSPNPWNPNRMTDFERASLKNGLETDGWLMSQALLIWGTDETGAKKDLIIDGEHRWTLACELGFVDGPMVYLQNMAEPQAKALTIKMNAKRGKFQDDLLANLLQDLQFELNVSDLPLDVGIPPEEMMRYLSLIPDVIVDETPGGGVVNHPPVHQAPLAPVLSQQGHVAMVQLFFSKDQHTELQELLKVVGAALGTKNASETVLEVLRRAGSNHPA